MPPTLRVGAFVWLVCLTLLAACRSGGLGESYEPAVRLNAEPGTLGRFTFPYYATITALPEGGAVAVWMRQVKQFRPLVYRRAASATAAFADEQFLSPEDLRATISIVPSLYPGGSRGELYATWQARRPVSGDKYVIFARSEDGGATWLPAQTINSRATSFVPSLAADPDGAVYSVWTDEREQGLKVYFNRSSDGGRTWLPADVRIDGSQDARSRALGPSIASDGSGRIVVVWEEQSSRGRVLRAVASADRGATWSGETRIDDGKRRTSPSLPTVVFASGRAIVMWSAASSGVGGVGEVWSDSSADGGLTWGEDVLLSDVSDGVSPRAHLTSDGTTARAVFHAGPLATGWQIYYAEIGSSGVWRATGAGLAQVSAGAGKFTNPRIAVDGPALTVVYEDDQKRILLSHSTDGGATWQVAREPVYVIEGESETTRYPQVAAQDGVAYVLWEVWADKTGMFKSFADLETKTRPADLYVRRVTFRS